MSVSQVFNERRRGMKRRSNNLRWRNQDTRLILSNLPPFTAEREFSLSEGIRLVHELGIEVKDAWFMMNGEEKNLVVRVDQSTNEEVIELMKTKKQIVWHEHSIDIKMKIPSSKRIRLDETSNGTKKQTISTPSTQNVNKQPVVHMIFEDFPCVRRYAMQIESRLIDACASSTGVPLTIHPKAMTIPMCKKWFESSIQHSISENALAVLFVERSHQTYGSVTLVLIYEDKSIEEHRDIPFNNAIYPLSEHARTRSVDSQVREIMQRLANGKRNLKFDEIDTVINFLQQLKQEQIVKQQLTQSHSLQQRFDFSQSAFWKVPERRD